MMNHGLFQYQCSIRQVAEEGAVMPSLSLDEYIERLQELRREHGGDIPVEKWMPAKGRHAAPPPELAFKRRYDAKKGGPEVSPQFYKPCYDTEAQRGDPVIRI